MKKQTFSRTSPKSGRRATLGANGRYSRKNNKGYMINQGIGNLEGQSNSTVTNTSNTRTIEFSRPTAPAVTYKYTHDQSLFPNVGVTGSEIISECNLTNPFHQAVANEIDNPDVIQDSITLINNLINATCGVADYFTYTG